MKSTSGEHYLALDHVRALAALLVFIWHFTHGSTGFPVPFEYSPRLPFFALFEEGHVGVALFMTLSGYLFAKLLNGKSIHYATFIWNRVLRLLPLLLVVVFLQAELNYLAGNPMGPYLRSILDGAILPTLPNGGWSITVEFHFYLVLPLILWMLRRSKAFPLIFLAAAIGVRFAIWARSGEVQSLAYWTIIGRIDQFLLGVLVFQYRDFFRAKHVMAGLVFCAFAAFYWVFDSLGGLNDLGGYPSPSPLWIIIPTIEGAAFAVMIAWYDSTFTHFRSRAARLIGKVGEYSYSIYLLHFYVAFTGAIWVNENVMSLSNFYVALAWGIGFFCLMIPIGYLSWRYIEEPFMRFRRPYVVRYAGAKAPEVAQTTRRASIL